MSDEKPEISYRCSSCDTEYDEVYPECPSCGDVYGLVAVYTFKEKYKELQKHADALAKALSFIGLTSPCNSYVYDAAQALKAYQQFKAQRGED